MNNQIVKPDLPGSGVTFVGETQQRVLSGFGSTVMLPATATWGPLGSELTDMDPITSIAEVDAIYGSNSASDLRTAAVLAFLGQNTPSGRGAGGVLPYRMATNAAAKATITIQNSTPANAIKFEGVYKGTFGNRLSVIIDNDPITAGSDRCRILLDGVTVESYTYVETNITSLKNQIAARPSKYVTVAATPFVTGLVLAPGTYALATGNDGSTLTSAEYLAALDAFEWADAGIIAPYNLTDTGIKASLLSWIRAMESNMRPVRAVTGGALAESLTDAMSDAALMRDPHMIRIGVGSYYSADLDATLSTAQLAPLIAGILAARGEKSALTRALTGGLSVVGGTGPSNDDLKLGRDAGVTMLRRVSHPDSSLAISQGVTTWNDLTSTAKPYKIWSEPRFIGIFDRLIRQIVAWGDDEIVGDVPVNEDTRAAVRKEMGKLLSDLEKDGLSTPGTSYVNVDDPQDPDLEDAIPFDFGFKPTRTANYLIGTGKVK